MLALMVAGSVANATELRLSHQWSNKDVRHKVAEIVANEVAAANVDLEIKIFGSKCFNSSKKLGLNIVNINLIKM